jgi:nicotinamidase-related amidase
MVDGFFQTPYSQTSNALGEIETMQLSASESDLGGYGQSSSQAIVQSGFAVREARYSMNQTLLLIDIQNDYFPDGAMELAGSLEAGVQAGKLLQVYRQKSLSVIHIQHISMRKTATFFLPNTKGVQIHESVAPVIGEAVFQKYYPNSFRETPLLEHLRRQQITQLVIAGMMTHMCVDTTTRAAADLGFHCLLAHDACATKSLSFGGATVSAEHVQTAFLAALNGLFATVLSVEELCLTLNQ